MNFKNERMIEYVKRSDLKMIDKIRTYLGLRKLQNGSIKCLKCNGKFFSRDLKTNKICDYCVRSNEKALNEII